MSSPELSRTLALESIGVRPLEFAVEASARECAALAARMGIPAILSLTCRFVLSRGTAGSIPASGRLEARVVQTCVVTAEDFEVAVGEDFEVRFVPAGTESEDLDLEGPDEIPYQGDRLDLGEAAAEQLALALDPFPRAPGAVLAEEPPEPARPFAALNALRNRH